MQNPNTELVFINYESKYYEQLKVTMAECYTDLADSHITHSEIELLSQLYHGGQILCFLNDELIGAIFSRIVSFEKYSKPHKGEDTYDINMFVEDSEKGESVYAMELWVKPAYQQLKVAKRLHKKLEEVTFKNNFQCLLAVSRITNYHKYLKEMDAVTYAHKVKNRELADPVLGFHLSNGVVLGDAFAGYITDDIKSAGFGIFIYLPNPNHNAQQPIYTERFQNAKSL